MDMKKILKPLALCFVLCLIISCDIRIPEVDSIPPTFSFQIQGDGFSRTFTQDDDFSRIQLNLRGNTEYRFIYSGADQGGVGLIQWQLGDRSQLEFIRPEFPFDSWFIRDVSALSRMIEWSGDREEPKTGAILSGSFRTSDIADNALDSGLFRFFVSDFGGQSGTSNNIRGNLNIAIQNSETSLSEF